MSDQVSVTYIGRRDRYKIVHDGVTYLLPRGRVTQVPPAVAERLTGRANLTVQQPAKSAKKAAEPARPAEDKEATSES